MEKVKPVPTVSDLFELLKQNFTVDDVNQFLSMTNATSLPTYFGAGGNETGEDLMQDEPAERMCNLEFLAESYKPVHGYLSLVMCIFGTIANVLNIVVLTRKEMNGSPINRILTGIAVADMLLMVEYIPYVVHVNLWKGRGKQEALSWNWAAFIWFHANFSVTIHNVSIWLTLSLAVWRFIMIRFHTYAPVYCTMRRCFIVLLCAYVVPIFLTLPNLFSLTIREVTLAIKEFESQAVRNVSIYVMSWSKDVDSNNDLVNSINNFLYHFNMWLYSVILKLVPCIVLTIITVFLILELYKAGERSQRLRNGANPRTATGSVRRYSHGTAAHTPVSPHVPPTCQNGHPTAVTVKTVSNKRKKSTDRTTRLLIAILVLFVLTEFPQGVLGLLTAILGDQFFKECFAPLGDLTDLMAITNSAINFILYCFMSKQFRKTFLDTFRLREAARCCKCRCGRRGSPTTVQITVNNNGGPNVNRIVHEEPRQKDQEHHDDDREEEGEEAKEMEALLPVKDLNVPRMVTMRLEVGDTTL